MAVKICVEQRGIVRCSRGKTSPFRKTREVLSRVTTSDRSTRLFSMVEGGIVVQCSKMQGEKIDNWVANVKRRTTATKRQQTVAMQMRVDCWARRRSYSQELLLEGKQRPAGFVDCPGLAPLLLAGGCSLGDRESMGKRPFFRPGFPAFLRQQIGGPTARQAGKVPANDLLLQASRSRNLLAPCSVCRAAVKLRLLQENKRVW